MILRYYPLDIDTEQLQVLFLTLGGLHNNRNKWHKTVIVQQITTWVVTE